MKTKRVLATAAIAALTMVLAGCISLKATISLDSEARGSGSMAISINKQLASFAGITSADTFEEQLTSDDSDLPPGSSIDVSESDTDFTATVSFEDTVLDDDDFGAKVLPNGDVEFTFVNEGAEPTEGEESPFGDIDTGTVTLTVNFPGEVKNFDGEGATQVDADTITWEFPFQTSTTATATSGVSELSLSATSATSASSSNTPLVVAGLAIIAAVVVGVVVLMSRRRDQVPATAGPLPTDPGSPPSSPGPHEPTI